MTKMKKALVTGSAGLIGSEAVKFFCGLGFDVIGIDNNMRQYFFGEEASTDWNRKILEDQFKNYKHFNLDIRDQAGIDQIFNDHKFDLIIHAAAQPSHDWAAKEPLTDFSVNATGTHNLLEAFRRFCPEAVFIFTSTNKVYGDTPNFLPLIELETRFEIDPSHKFKNGIDESMSIDQSKHSIFGASKVAADVMVQEYGRYFNLKTALFRGGCLTGPSHSGTKLHGFLAYLVKCIAEGYPYTIFGYKGKQVRDNIHSSDLIAAFYEFYKNPRIGEVYNMGGSRFSNVSMMEAIEKIESYLGRKGDINYIDQNRAGDHIWYVSDVSKFRSHYPSWEYKYDIDAIISEICELGHFSKPSLVGSSVMSEISVGTKDKVFVASHVTEVHGPVQALKAYLIKKYPKFIFVEHPFTYSTLPSTKIEAFRASLPSFVTSQKKFGNEILSYINDFWQTLYWFLKSGRDSRVFIGIDNLNAFAGVLLKLLGFKFKLIYYAIDYSPKRFSNSLLNSLYHLIEKMCVKNADFVWNSSDRMLGVRKTQVSDDRKNLVVSSGVNLEKIRVPEDKKDKNTLVVVDHLTESKGIQEVILALPKILKNNPKAKLLIIGTGPYENALKKLVEEKNLGGKVVFKGALDPDSYLKDLGGYGIGLALYDSNKDSSIYFADPITTKEYLACGLPIVVSDATWFSKDVKDKELGEVVKDSRSLPEALKKLWGDEKYYKKCSKNAINYMSSSSWNDVFDKAFKNTGL